MIITLPVPDGPNWIFDVLLGDTVYSLRGLWNERLSRWAISIFTIEGDPIVVGDPINLNFPLFFGSRDARLPNGNLIVVSPVSSVNEDPGRDAFTEGGSYRLVYIPNE